MNRVTFDYVATVDFKKKLEWCMFLFNCKIRGEFNSNAAQAISALEHEFGIDVLFTNTCSTKSEPAYAYSRSDQKLDETLIRSSAIALLFPYFRIEGPCNLTNNK